VRIGITGIGYQCGEHLAEVLEPWFDLKARGQHEIFISLAYGIFPEVYAVTRINGEPPDDSIQFLRKYVSERKIDALFVSPEPKYEWDLRTCTLPFLLSRPIDLLWLLDLQDEIYSVEEILRIIDFSECHHEVAWFKINFKNYAFASDCYVDNFIVPRVWRARVPAAIRRFHHDNSITYENGQVQENLPHCTIPSHLAFPKHLSWVGPREYLKRKIKFQNLHYGICAYKWNDEKDCLEFNGSYFRKLRKQLPEVHREMKCS